MPPRNNPQHQQGQNTGRRNTMIGVIALVVVGLLLFVFMSPNQTSTTDTMQQGTSTQDQGQQVPAGTANPGATTINDPTTTDLDQAPQQPNTQP
ncbi:MAG: hypothetical protein IKD58_10340 [Loktanella sp.]|nr:hypothetical protein [Loktanella sp.]